MGSASDVLSCRHPLGALPPLESSRLAWQQESRRLSRLALPGSSLRQTALAKAVPLVESWRLAFLVLA